MKPVLESISIPNEEQSVLIFARKEPHFGPYWHYHPEVELTLITQGNGMRFVGDSIQNYSKNDLVLVGKNLPHQWISSIAEEQDAQQVIVVQFPVTLFANYPECKEIKALLEAASSGIFFKAPSAHLLDQIKELITLPKPLQISNLLSILFQLIGLKQETLSTRTTFRIHSLKKHQEKLNRTINYIVDHISEPLTVSQMAEETSMVPQSFCRWFKQQTGNSFISFLNNTRIQNACQLLLSSNRPVGQIAFEVGFENVTHFNRTFKKIIGRSPTDYRKNNIGLS